MSDGPTVLQLHRGPVYPPSNGEEVRIWKTAQKFGEFGSALLAHPTRDFAREDGVRSIQIDNAVLDYKLTRIYAWNAWLAAAPDNWFDRLQTARTVADLSAIDRSIDVVCCENPQMLRAGRRLADRFDAAFLLDKHNAMFDLLDQQLGSRPIPDPLRRRAVRSLRELEQRGIEAADAVVFQSARDRERFRLPEDTLVEVIPNGTDVESVDETGDPDRLRAELGIGEDATICLFVGACDYEPNADAAERIVSEIAPRLPDVEFLIVGRDPPETDRQNVLTPGFVEDLDGALALADVGLCPLTLGSGTKLKMMDYLAAGLPIVTTEVGAQGIPIEDGETALVRSSPAEFVAAIERLRGSESLRSDLAESAADLGRQFRWESRLDAYEDVLAALTDDANRERSVRAGDNV